MILYFISNTVLNDVYVNILWHISYPSFELKLQTWWKKNFYYFILVAFILMKKRKKKSSSQRIKDSQVRD